MNGIRNSSFSRIDETSWYALKISLSSRPQRLDDVLIGVGVDGLLEGLAQQELSALGRGDVAVGAQHDVVGRQRIGSDEEAEIALDDAALVFGQTVWVFPCRDVARHVDFVGHPVIGARGEVFLPRPLVLEGHQLVDVGAAVDDAFVSRVDSPSRGIGLRCRYCNGLGRGDCKTCHRCSHCAFA